MNTISSKCFMVKNAPEAVQRLFSDMKESVQTDKSMSVYTNKTNNISFSSEDGYEGKAKIEMDKYGTGTLKLIVKIKESSGEKVKFTLSVPTNYVIATIASDTPSITKDDANELLDALKRRLTVMN